MTRPAATGVALIALGLLCGCHAQSQDSQADQMPVPPADAPPSTPAALFGGSINAVGTEPFWQLEIRADHLKLTGPDRPELVTPNPGPKISGSTAVWIEAPADGRPPLTVTAEILDCTDGMSDRRYPLTVRIESTAERLHGCGGPEAPAPPKPAAGEKGALPPSY